MHTFPAIGRRRVTADEQLAQAEANGYKSEEQKEKDEVPSRHKYMGKIKEISKRSFESLRAVKVDFFVKNELDTLIEPRYISVKYKGLYTEKVVRIGGGEFRRLCKASEVWLEEQGEERGGQIEARI